MHSIIRCLGEHRRHVSPLVRVRCSEAHCPEGPRASRLLTAQGKTGFGWACPAALGAVTATSSFGALDLLDLVS